MKRLALVLGVLILGAPWGAPAAAQSVPGLAVEVRGGAALPIGDFADGPLEAGAGYGASAALFLRLLPMAEIYGRYEYANLACSGCESVGLDDSVEEAGFSLGARASLPPLAGYGLWVSGGAIFHRFQLTGLGDGATSDTATGFELGAGLEVPLTQQLRLSPGVHFRNYSAELELANLEFPPESVDFIVAEADVSYVGLDVGLSYHF